MLKILDLNLSDEQIKKAINNTDKLYKDISKKDNRKIYKTTLLTKSHNTSNGKIKNYLIFLQNMNWYK